MSTAFGAVVGFESSGRPSGANGLPSYPSDELSFRLPDSPMLIMPHQPACVRVAALALAVSLLAGCGSGAPDGRYDRGRNGLWLQHGWLGHDSWFHRYKKTHLKEDFRDPERVREMLSRDLQSLHFTDVFPHLAPTDREGRIQPVDHEQTLRFLQILSGIRVMPWVGGVEGKQVTLGDPQWRDAFARSIRILLTRYPGLAGIHINIEPCPSGDPDFLELLDQVRAALPEGRVLSVAAFPPPTWWDLSSAVHWDEDYYREVAQRADQLVVMMYDTGLRFQWAYRWLVATWTGKILKWSGSTSVLLGLPAYEDKHVPWHDPGVENLGNALSGVKNGLGRFERVPPNYQGVAVYADWELDEAKRSIFRREFLADGD